MEEKVDLEIYNSCCDISSKSTQMEGSVLSKKKIKKSRKNKTSKRTKKNSFSENQNSDKKLCCKSKKNISFTSERKKIVFDFYPFEEDKLEVVNSNFQKIRHLKYDYDVDSDTDTIKNAVWHNYSNLLKTFKTSC